jgi:hypothetical protein
LEPSVEVGPFIIQYAHFNVDLFKRGEHNIETEIMYPTDFGFVFHDSMGFEAGAKTELKEVERFLASRAQKEQLKDRVHAIWCG